MGCDDINVYVSKAGKGDNEEAVGSGVGCLTEEEKWRPGQPNYPGRVWQRMGKAIYPKAATSHDVPYFSSSAASTKKDSHLNCE